MKQYMRKYLPAFFSILLAINVFIYNSLTVYAFPKRLLDGTWIDIPWSEAGEEIYQTIMYGLSQIGVLVTGADFEQWLKNSNTYKDLFDENGRLAKNLSIDTETGTVIYNKEIMIVLKEAANEYAKQEQTKEENGGFYLLPTTKIDDVSTSDFQNSYQYRTFRNIVTEKGVLPVMTNYRGLGMRFIDPFSDPDHPILLVGNVANLNSLKEHPYLPVSCTFYCADEWTNHSFTTMTFHNNQVIYTSVEEGEELNSDISTHNKVSSANVNYDIENYGVSPSWSWVIYSTTGERVRVFVSQYAAQNYSVGNRKIYFTENYYNYVPEDLTVSIDDLQKSVDDLQKIIDELLKKINDQTSEKEIEELLRLILEELRKNPGTGSGSGSGGGDVTVSVDLKETNSWLSKIYTRLGDILSKMSETAGQSMNEVVEGIENLKEMLEKYLKTITSDLDDIKGQLENMSEEEFNDRSDSFLNSATESFSEIGEAAKTKFPFSIPNDMKNFLAVLAQTSPEAAGLYSAESPGISLYSGEHGGGGASRPGSDGFIYVEHGGHGGGGVSREPSELVNGAPVFALPIVIERYGIEEYVIIDMAPFESISKLSRSLFTMMFMLCLFNLTFKVMGLWGDLVND